MRLTIVVLGLFAGLVPAAFAETKHLMAAMGDSITAATFADKSADLSRGDRLPEDNRIPFLGNLENKEKLSWASGKDVTSHFIRLQQFLAQTGGGTLAILNVSVPGDKAVNLEPQAKQVLQAMQSGSYASLKYVTLMIGANDACAEGPDGTPNAEMGTQLLKAFSILAQVQQTDRIAVLVSSIPKIPDLGVPSIVAARTVGNLTCGTLRDNMLKECVPLTVWKTAGEYDTRLTIVRSKNTLLRDVVDEANRRFPSLDIVYNARFYDTAIEPPWMASDCFHPNAQGQREISRRLWDDQPWFK